MKQDSAIWYFSQGIKRLGIIKLIFSLFIIGLIFFGYFYLSDNYWKKPKEFKDLTLNQYIEQNQLMARDLTLMNIIQSVEQNGYIRIIGEDIDFVLERIK